jgi:hypothetical protein
MVKQYTNREKASLRRQWRDEFQARNPEDYDTKRAWNYHENEEAIIIGPNGYVALYSDGTAIEHGICQDIFEHNYR